MDEVVFRLATSADIDSLVALRVAFLAEIAETDPTDTTLLEALKQYFAVAIPTGEFSAYLAQAHGQIIATSGLVYHRQPPSARNLAGREAYIINMYTLPMWRGRVIAAELLKRLLVPVLSAAVYVATPLISRASG